MDGLIYGIGMAVVIYGGWMAFTIGISNLDDWNKARKARKRKK